jgi:hypothetical protein
MTALSLRFFTNQRGFIPAWASWAIAFPQRHRFVLLCLGGISAGLLVGCDRLQPESSWQLYRNSRYGFEFPYPTGWVAEVPPDNQDGQAFRAPNRPGVEIAGWASQIPDLDQKSGELLDLDPSTPELLKENFVTEQGLPAELAVQIAAGTSSLNLSVVHEGVLYRWQGRSPSNQFEDYYKFFSYIAGEYRVLSEEE